MSKDQPGNPISPYRKTLDAAYEAKWHTRLRWEKTMTFIKVGPAASRGLDIGERSSLTTQLELFFNCPFDSTTIDLDVDPLTERYDVVTCFEIIEHLFNPLHLLLQIREVVPPGGRLYLSTPSGKPHFLWSSSHFHEMSFSSIKALFDRAGFSILRKKKITTYPWWFYFKGVRPLLRAVFERTWLFELSAEKKRWITRKDSVDEP